MATHFCPDCPRDANGCQRELLLNNGTKCHGCGYELPQAASWAYMVRLQKGMDTRCPDECSAVEVIRDRQGRGDKVLQVVDSTGREYQLIEATGRLVPLADLANQARTELWAMIDTVADPVTKAALEAAVAAYAYVAGGCDAPNASSSTRMLAELADAVEVLNDRTS